MSTKARDFAMAIAPVSKTQTAFNGAIQTLEEARDILSDTKDDAYIFKQINVAQKQLLIVHIKASAKSPQHPRIV